MSQDISQFIDDFAGELAAGNAAYFIGAGISVNSNLPTWINLIKPFTDKIGISDLSGKDMPLMAQYVINDEAGNRGPFINGISRKLRRSFTPNAYHEYIANTNLKTIWTTNYDDLLEKAFSNAIIDVKFNDEAVSRDVPESKIEIIKMHGCIFNSPNRDIVISQSDYEDFLLNRPATAQRLRMDLLQKSFLFIGYGYGDPNIKNIITEARRLAGNNTRQHYLILKDQKGDIEFELWCRNLRKYGIRVIKIVEYADLLPILQKLSLKSRGKSVFISGSHDSKNDEEAEKLGKALAKEQDVILNDGQSSGLMRISSRFFMEALIDDNADINKRLRFFPNPYAFNSKFANDVSLLPLLKQWRTPLLRATQVMIAFDGGMGTKAEIEVALDMGCIVIPFFKDSNKETWYLLESRIINERLNHYDNGFIENVKQKRVGHLDVLQLVKAILL
ncbi:SIR2 family protein [Mucilaginibacter hurinus]|uniref:SIR2 family protein n=1 Tax=Mucilaginibacter hurinus TaxID=2201324 RepID=A0A367GSZ6_9SPHI|nr:SIR2 family protein [Mucilaginibacter hurinus]RCH56288.1 SIR2 family protein [Mucilaginibacter hurinus]